MTEAVVPPQREFYNPVLQALHNLGGSGTTQEIYDEVVKLMGLTDAQLKVPTSPGADKKALVATHLSWARSHLKSYGLLENPRRGVWTLTAEGRNTKQVDSLDVQRIAMQIAKKKREQKENLQEKSIPLAIAEDVNDSPVSLEELTDVQDLIASLSGWRDELSGLLHGMSPAAFERFFLRIFRKDGIEAVDVTGRSGDDMIEGMMESGGFLSLRVSFRCIRGSRLISADEVQDFRRAVEVGGAHKGVLVTTGSFTQEAVREAGRGGASDIDLIDGEQLIDKLKELSLGVKTERVVVERVMIDREWFDRI